MAIVEMKRMNLIAPMRDKRALLDTIQKLGCVQLSATEEDGGFHKQSKIERLEKTNEEITRVQWAIGRLAKFDKQKPPLLGGKPAITGEEAAALLCKQPELMKTVEALEALERESGELRGQTARLLALREQLEPWTAFPVPISEVHSTKYTVATLGTAQKSGVEALLEANSFSPLCMVTLVSTVRDAANLYVVAHRDAADELFQKLKEVGFTPLVLNGVENKVSQKMTEIDQELNQLSKQQEEIVAATASHVGVITELKTLFDCLGSMRERLVAEQDLLGSKSTFYLRGWTPVDLTQSVEKQLHKTSPSACMEFTDPDEGEEPPVLLHNNPLVSPYESIVSGFSLPTYHGLDPTAIMMPFFINFMGMMVSDAGYGVLMALLIPILIKVMKPSPGAKRLMWILVGGGVMTIFWGALYNTWFGFAPWPSLFDPINSPMPVMGLCIALGAVHLFAGLGVAAYMNIKSGHAGAAIADQLSWFLVIVGLALMLVLPAVGQWMAIAGVCIILVTAGREKSKNPFKRLISGLGALYGITSWVSDLLSYMRLFGMGLATGVIGMVINQLVGMVFASGPIGIVLGSALFVGGHLFNAGINILGAYVHSCRLQYIEFFGKFYEDGGKPFKPLATTNRYCYIKEAPENS
ncbi:MAG: V-type ATP synthase subunit I [Clostridia bacterium]